MESGRAPFQSHAGRFFEELNPPGRDGRACGPPLRRWGRALFVRPIGRGCRCDSKRGPAVWSVLFCHSGERLHKEIVVSRLLDSDGVGACPRQARPGRPGGIDSKRRCCTERAAPPFFVHPNKTLLLFYTKQNNGKQKLHKFIELLFFFKTIVFLMKSQIKRILEIF